MNDATITIDKSDIKNDEFLVEETGIYQQVSDNYYKKILSKEAFVEAFSKYIGIHTYSKDE